MPLGISEKPAFWFMKVFIGTVYFPMGGRTCIAIDNDKQSVRAGTQGNAPLLPFLSGGPGPLGAAAGCCFQALSEE